MNGWLLLAIVAAVGALFYLASHFGWIDLSNKNRSGTPGGVLGVGDEVFNASKYEAQVELDRQTVLPAPAPLPGDKGRLRQIADEPEQESSIGAPLSKYRGSVHIDLDEEPRR
ncbi:hypothetical protein [Glaciihabitans sp. dw_435]|uniref:hypothetical protein n=1 Tax=Glaciihabitans sp. dw_435 TaxID=2720081 RepID=UPI001BD21FD0|nr:hypothetical protein [Glaciihabitans sp. dw_435]